MPVKNLIPVTPEKYQKLVEKYKHANTDDATGADDTGKQKKAINPDSLVVAVDPNAGKPETMFINGSPAVWEAAFLQMANAKVPQPVINRLYHKLRASNDMFDVTELGIHLLRRLKLASGPDENTPESVLEWLADAFGVIAGTTDFPHSPKLDVLENQKNEAFRDLGIAALFDSSIDIQHISTDNPQQLVAAGEMATACVNGRVPFDQKALDFINENLDGKTSDGSPSFNNLGSTMTGQTEHRMPISTSSDDINEQNLLDEVNSMTIQPRKRASKSDTTKQPASDFNNHAVSATPVTEPIPTTSTTPTTPAPAPDPVPTTPEPPVVDSGTNAAITSTDSMPTPASVPSHIDEPADVAAGDSGETVDVVATEEDIPETAGEQAVPDKEVHVEEPSHEEPDASDDGVAGVVAGDLDDSREPAEVSAAEEKPSAEEAEPEVTDEEPARESAPAQPARRPTVPQKVLMEIYSHAGTPDQIKEAVHLVEQDIADNTPNAQFLSRYVPGVTQEIVKDILVNRTASGKYINRQAGMSGTAIPHTNLSGGTTFTSPVRSRAIGPVEVPPGFAQENSSVLWDEPVITTMGFPFINFGAPEIYTILKDKDETKVKKAYKKLKAQLKKVGLDSPIKVLKDFKHAKGVRCALNRITVDADELLANGNADVIASVYPRVSVGMRSAIGSVPLTRDFIVEMYKVLSPTKGARIYMDALGMDEAEYADTLNRDGKPPLYIFIPKEQLAFTKAPAGFIARLLTSGNKPTLVEARIGTHSGGFVMPFKTTRLLFSEI